MATVYGTTRTAIRAGGLSNQLAKGLVDGRVKAMIDTYEAAALADASTIVMGENLPAGARVQLVRVSHDALAGAITYSVGDSAAGARYVAVGAQGASAAGAVLASLVDGQDYVVGTATGDNQIQITTSGGSTATGTIKILVLYTQD